MIALLTPFSTTPATAAASRPMLRVGQHPVVAHDLRWLVAQGIRQVAIDVRPLEATGVVEFVGDGSSFGLEAVHFVRPAQAGSAAALCDVRALGGDDAILVVDSGRLFAFDLAALLREHTEGPAIATMAVYDRAGREPIGENDWRFEIDRTGRVVRLSPPALAPELELVGAGAAVVESKLVDHVPADRPFDLQRDLFTMVVREGGVLAAHRIRGRSFELDTPEAREAAALVFSS